MILPIPLPLPLPIPLPLLLPFGLIRDFVMMIWNFITGLF